MKPTRLYATLVLASACAGQAVTTPAPMPARSDTGAPRVMTAEDVIALDAVSDAQISPDGQSVAYVVTRADMTQDASDADVWVVSTTGGAPRRLTTSRKMDNVPRWSTDSRRIAFLSTRDGRPQLYVMNASGGTEEKLTTRKGAVRQFEWSPDGRSIAYVADVDLTADDERRAKDKDDAVVVDSAYRFTRLWVMPVADRTDHPTDHPTEHMLATPEGVASDPRWSPDGSRIAYVVTPTPKADDGQLSDIWTSPLDGGAPRRLVDNPGPDHSPRWSPDGQQIAYLTASGTDLRQSHLAIVASVGGTPRVVAPGFPFQMGAATWSPDGATLWFNAAVRTTSEQYSVPAAGGMPVARTSVEGSVGAATFSADGRMAAYIQSDMLHPADVYITAVGTGAFAPTRLSDHNPQVRRFLLGRSEVVRWKSTDGLDIDGVLLYPVGYREGRRYPMVVEVHGGPAGAWSQAFPGSWGNAGQVLAGKGWLVFYPNPRGSSSYGETFLRANIKDWGGGDYRDIQTGIDALIARGLADSTRLGQSGWSYGGYMTAWTLTQTNRFRALVIGAGLTDMYSMYGTNDLPKTLDNYFGAEPWNDTTGYRRHSAMTYIKQARTPTLILHGQADQRVPIGQSQELYLGLKRNGVPVQLVFYPREPHGLGEPRHQLDKLRREQEWLAHYVLGNEATQAPQAALVP